MTHQIKQSQSSLSDSKNDQKTINHRPFHQNSFKQYSLYLILFLLLFAFKAIYCTLPIYDQTQIHNNHELFIHELVSVTYHPLMKIYFAISNKIYCYHRTFQRVQNILLSLDFVLGMSSRRYFLSVRVTIRMLLMVDCCFRIGMLLFQYHILRMAAIKDLPFVLLQSQAIPQLQAQSMDKITSSSSVFEYSPSLILLPQIFVSWAISQMLSVPSCQISHALKIVDALCTKSLINPQTTDQHKSTWLINHKILHNWFKEVDYQVSELTDGFFTYNQRSILLYSRTFDKILMLIYQIIYINYIQKL